MYSMHTFEQSNWYYISMVQHGHLSSYDFEIDFKYWKLMEILMKDYLVFSFKGARMQIWKSSNIFVFI